MPSPATMHPSAAPPDPGYALPTRDGFTIFVSHRRDDAAYVARMLYDRLVQRFGVAGVFMGTEAIPLGVDFRDYIERTVGSCSVLIAVVGPEWLCPVGSGGHYQIDSLVHVEIATALRRNIRVIPVLVEGGTLPRPEELPPDIAGLGTRAGIELRYQSFEADAAYLLDALASMGGGIPAQPAGASREQARPAVAVGTAAPAHATPALHHGANQPGTVAVPRARASAMKRTGEGTSRKIAVIALSVLVLVLGGLVALVVVLTRDPGTADRATPSPARIPGPVASADPLLTQIGTVRALLARIHSRGKESVELANLIDAEAAAFIESLSRPACTRSDAACEASLLLRRSLLVGDESRQIARSRAADATVARERPGWLLELKAPEIPVQDDDRVQRSLDYYARSAAGREAFQAMLFRCGAYRDLILSTLSRYGLPSDLWAIVFVQSGCSPEATSLVGGAGLWQLTPAVARAYRLRMVDGVLDERRSPAKSTEAAARYLRDLREKLTAYSERGVWDLSLGSQSVGHFELTARLETAGGPVIGLWDLVNARLLPEDTAKYASTVQAVAFVLKNQDKLRLSASGERAPRPTAELTVPPGTRLGMIAHAASTSVVEIQALNLDLIGESTPDIADFPVQIPRAKADRARDRLKALVASGDRQDQCVSSAFDWGRQAFTPAMARACEGHASPTPRPRPSPRQEPGTTFF